MSEATLFPLVFLLLGIGDLLAGLWLVRQGQPSPADSPEDAMQATDQPPIPYFLGKGLALGGVLTAAWAVAILLLGRELPQNTRLLVLVSGTVACMAIPVGWQLLRSQRDETHRTGGGISPD